MLGGLGSEEKGGDSSPSETGDQSVRCYSGAVQTAKHHLGVCLKLLGILYRNDEELALQERLYLAMVMLNSALLKALHVADSFHVHCHREFPKVVGAQQDTPMLRFLSESSCDDAPGENGIARGNRPGIDDDKRNFVSGLTYRRLQAECVVLAETARSLEIQRDADKARIVQLEEECRELEQNAKKQACGARSGTAPRDEPRALEKAEIAQLQSLGLNTQRLTENGIVISDSELRNLVKEMSNLSRIVEEARLGAVGAARHADDAERHASDANRERNELRRLFDSVEDGQNAGGHHVGTDANGACGGGAFGSASLQAGNSLQSVVQSLVQDMRGQEETLKGLVAEAALPTPSRLEVGSLEEHSVSATELEKLRELQMEGLSQRCRDLRLENEQLWEQVLSSGADESAIIPSASSRAESIAEVPQHSGEMTTADGAAAVATAAVAAAAAAVAAQPSVPLTRPPAPPAQPPAQPSSSSPVTTGLAATAGAHRSTGGASGLALASGSGGGFGGGLRGTTQRRHRGACSDSTTSLDQQEFQDASNPSRRPFVVCSSHSHHASAAHSSTGRRSVPVSGGPPSGDNAQGALSVVSGSNSGFHSLSSGNVGGGGIASSVGDSAVGHSASRPGIGNGNVLDTRSAYGALLEERQLAKAALRCVKNPADAQALGKLANLRSSAGRQQRPTNGTSGAGMDLAVAYAAAVGGGGLGAGEAGRPGASQTVLGTRTSSASHVGVAGSPGGLGTASPSTPAKDEVLRVAASWADRRGSPRPAMSTPSLAGSSPGGSAIDARRSPSPKTFAVQPTAGRVGRFISETSSAAQLQQSAPQLHSQSQGHSSLQQHQQHHHQQQPQQHQQQQMSMHGVGLQQPMSAPHAAFVSPTPYRDPSLASTAHVERSNGYPPVSSAVGMPPAPATGCVVGGDPAGNVTGGYGVAPSAFTSVGVVGADAVRPVEKLSVTPSFAGVGPAALAAAPVQRMPMPPSEPPPAEPSAAVGGAPPLGTPPVVALQQESLGTPSQTISEDSQGLSQSESASRGQGLSASSAGASSAAALGLITAEAKERMLDPKDPKARSRAKASVPKKSLAEVLRAHRKAEETILKAMRSQNSSRLCVAELRAMSEPVYHFYIDFVNFCCPSNLPQSDEQQWEMLCKALKKHFEKEFGANQTQKPAQPQRPNNTLGDFITIQTESKSAKKNKVNRAGGGGGGRGGRAAGANEKKDGLAAGGSDCAGGAEDSTAQSSSWVCPLCTLRNENLQLECGACGTSQHQASLWKEFPPLG
eukprot:TRINITY_DN19226_c0_g3_i1.p1 TRINITY_DN19226_c0_g3~~TRINITY_DN19226_c0_g3_i1.p1  ORF type:complete len:1329 (+),score=260.05 TRINITY_DN19226_c0_g3_i1:172-3987(+)